MSPRAIWKADGTMGSGERGNKRVLSGRDPVPGVLSPNLQYAFKCSSDAGGMCLLLRCLRKPKQGLKFTLGCL